MIEYIKNYFKQKKADRKNRKTIQQYLESSCIPEGVFIRSLPKVLKRMETDLSFFDRVEDKLQVRLSVSFNKTKEDFILNTDTE